MIALTNEPEEMIEVLYNDCYGGWGLSKEAKDRYNELSKERSEGDDDKGTRHDPLKIKVYKELLDKFSGPYAAIKCTSIPKRYKNYYDISEYDGKESVDIDIAGYKRAQRDARIRTILENKYMSATNKVDKLKVIFSISDDTV